MTPTATRWMLLGVVVLLIVWDVLAVRAEQWDATVSAVVTDTARRFPIVPFLVGVCAGHWFWSQEQR